MATQRMYELKIYMRGTEKDAAKLVGSEMVVLPMPPGGLDTIKTALTYSAAVIEATHDALADVLAILDDPNGQPAEMSAALSKLAHTAQAHKPAHNNLVNVLTVLGTALVADQFGTAQDSGKGGLQ